MGEGKKAGFSTVVQSVSAGRFSWIAGDFQWGLLLVRELDERMGAVGTAWEKKLCLVGPKWV